MNKTIFIGGSRHISKLAPEMRERINNVISAKHDVLVGDANGVDKAVQKHLFDSGYDRVTVYCSGDQFRNNIGGWPTNKVTPPKSAKGFQFYAAKDREMAARADIGLMIWDGKSAGTVLNVMRLAHTGKTTVLYNAAEKRVANITPNSWDTFLEHCSEQLRADLQTRATPEEWRPKKPSEQISFFEGNTQSSGASEDLVAPEEDFTKSINLALASSDSASFVNALREYVRSKGMTQVARETGLARESLYRSLSAEGNPEFTTVLKVMSAIGLRFAVKQSSSA